MTNNIKLLCFDLDGTMVQTKKLHRDILNEAIHAYAPKYFITEEDHFTTFEGMTTKEKLRILVHRGLPVDIADQIDILKQEKTADALAIFDFNVSYEAMFAELHKTYSIIVCTNTIRKSAEGILKKIGILHHLDMVFTNEDVLHPKPHPEIYRRAMQFDVVSPLETLIFEDAPVGLQSAYASGAYVRKVRDPSDLTLDMVYSTIDIIHAHQAARVIDHTLTLTTSL